MSIAPSFVTPLRYPGGKGRLGFWIGNLLAHNNIESGCYIEPYAGGAGAAFYLLKEKKVNQVIINDADPAIYAFWWSVLNDTERLIKLINDTEVTMESWERAREVLFSNETPDLTLLGFATFFLNRTNRSGIIKGGVIGGKSQTGKFKLDARFNKPNLIERIRQISSARDHISVCNLDAKAFIIETASLEPKNTLFYLDPPYFNKSDKLYRNHYKYADHQEIATLAQSLSTPWMVTYDNCTEITELYDQSQCVEFSFHYSTHNSRPIAKELMFYGNLAIPSTPQMRR